MDTSPSPGLPEDLAELLGKSLPVLCPTCEVELELGVLFGTEFAGCPLCQGMLFQTAIFGGLIQRLRKLQRSKQIPQPMNPSELHVQRRCPACHHRFETHPYGGPGNAVIDSCSTCHLIWLDMNELNKLATAQGKD